MSVISPLVTIPVGVLVERSKGVGPWSEFFWRPVAVLSGVPDTPAWTQLSDDGERASFYAGAADIELYRSEASNYRDNLMAEAPLLWVALYPNDADQPFGLVVVTADPAEGEAWVAMPGIVVDSVPMPAVIGESVAAFVSEHHVERAFSKRKRDRPDPEAMGRRKPQGQDGKP